MEQGPRRAHAGIMAAATAIWRDLRSHRILPALLNVSGDSDDEDNPEYDIGAGAQLLTCDARNATCCTADFAGRHAHEHQYWSSEKRVVLSLYSGPVYEAFA